jgi:mono/diheme cytochrome c family protein
MKAWRRQAAAIVVVASTIVTVDAQVQSQPYSGSADYQTYCASCHGAGARGDGMLAKSLKKHPADLTQLTKRNNGVFPDEKALRAIDGRQTATAHSPSDMPAWGDVLARSSESAGAENAAARIEVLVKYLQTVQAKE